MKKIKKSIKKYWLPLTIFALMLVVVVYPAATVMVKSFSAGGEAGLDNFIQLFTQPRFFNTVWQSILVASGVSVTSTLLGLILALVVFKTTLPLRKTFGAAAVIPIIIPGFVATLSFIFLFGRNGLLTYQLFGLSPDVYSWKSVFIIQSLDSVVTTFLLISAVLTSIDSQLEDAARNLGAGEWKVLTTVTLPLSRLGIIGAMLLVFMGSMSDFGTPLIVGGRFSTLASASYSQLVGNYNLEMASTLNVVLMVICLIVFYVYSRVQSSENKIRMQAGSQQRKMLALPKPVLYVMWTVCLLFSLYIFSQLAGVFLAAFTKHLGANYGLTLEYFQRLPVRRWNSILNSLGFATITAVVMSLSGIVIAYLVTRMEFRGRSLLDLVTTLPHAIPGTLFGVGYVMAFNQPPLLLTGTWFIVLLLTVIRQLPLGLRSGVSVLSQQDRSTEDASLSLGANRLVTFWKVILPGARNALLVSALYAFVITIQTVGAIIFVINPGTKLLSIDVFIAVYKGEIGFAAALSVVMLLISAVGMVCIYVITQREAAIKWFSRAIGRTPAIQG
ncbi:MAG: iron ABC transporter permease [Dehalococcoidales bacterium]|nr:iron ABC transporter permease [Dehalococcoidales bacterium]